MSDRFKDAQYALDYIEEEYPYKKGTVGGGYIEKVRLALTEAEHYKNECLEQARLLGISASKELLLMAEVDQLRKRVTELEAFIETRGYEVPR